MKSSIARWLFAAVFAVCLVGVALRAEDAKEGTVKGFPLHRGNGHWIGIDVSSGSFVLHFYDEHKKKESSDIAKAVLHWPVHYQPNQERRLLVANGEGDLASEIAVKAPHAFKLYISLFTDGKDDPVEEYTVDFHE